MEIRQAGESDLDTVVQLRLEFLAAHRDVHPESFSSEFTAGTRAFIFRKHEAGSLRSWVAEATGRTVGVVSMLLLDLAPRPEDVSGREGYIINMYVDPYHRRQRIGRALLEECLSAAEKLELRRLLLYASDEGRPMYATAGFSANQDWMELPLRPGAGPHRSSARQPETPVASGATER